MSGISKIRFDEEVTTRLKVHRDRTLESLSDRERWLLNLTRTELNTEAVFDASEPRFQYHGNAAQSGHYHLDWKKANENGDTFYRQGHPLATALIESALTRNLATASLAFDYAAYGSVIRLLKPLIGQSGWLQCSKLSIQSLDVEEFLLLAGRTDSGLAGNSQDARKFDPNHREGLLCCRIPSGTCCIPLDFCKTTTDTLYNTLVAPLFRQVKCLWNDVHQGRVQLKSNAPFELHRITAAPPLMPSRHNAVLGRLLFFRDFTSLAGGQR